MRRSIVLAIVALAGVVATGTPVRAQNTDPMLGTWVLNLAKSKYSLTPAPRSQTRTYSMSGAMVKFTLEGVGADGKPAKSEYSAAYDGKDYPLTGNAVADMISLKRVDATTVEATLKKGGKVVSTTIRVVSKDGKTMTATTAGKNAKGEKVTDVSVFDKK